MISKRKAGIIELIIELQFGKLNFFVLKFTHDLSTIKLDLFADVNTT